MALENEDQRNKRDLAFIVEKNKTYRKTLHEEELVFQIISTVDILPSYFAIVSHINPIKLKKKTPDVF